VREAILECRELVDDVGDNRIRQVELRDKEAELRDDVVQSVAVLADSLFKESAVGEEEEEHREEGGVALVEGGVEQRVEDRVNRFRKHGSSGEVHSSLVDLRECHVCRLV
jgi:hypothetical protein